MKIFITGDRSLHPLVAVAAVAQTVSDLVEKYSDGEHIQFYTGSVETGVERAVRYLVPDVQVIVHSLTDEGYIDFDGRHEIMKAEADIAVLIHPSPLESRIGASLAKSFADEKLVIV